MTQKKISAVVIKDNEPYHFGEAVKDRNQCAALQAEIYALKLNKT
jgi:hypothetical protein